MVQYDEKIIQEFADALYSKAMLIIFWVIVKGILLWATISTALGFTLSYTMFHETFDSQVILFGPAIIIIFMIAGIFIGYKRGKHLGEILAFQYKLQAQTALCQVKIEQNTRK